MLAYRYAHLGKGKSPAELLMGRKLRTRLPSVKYRQEKLQKRTTRSNDRGKPLPELHPRVKYHNARQGQWPVEGRVMKSSGPRSYDVELEDGRVMRRNRQNLFNHKGIVPAIQWANAEAASTDGCHPRCEYTRSAIIERVAHMSTT